MAAFFHLKSAAECNVVVALMAMAQMYCGLPHDILSDSEPPSSDPKIKVRIGLDYMERAAQAGERSAMVYLARAYDTGLNLPDTSMKDVSRALYWYECIEDLDDEEGDGSGMVSSSLYSSRSRVRVPPRFPSLRRFFAKQFFLSIYV